MKDIGIFAFCFQLFIFACASENANFCFNCISPEFKQNLDRFLEVMPQRSSIMFSRSKRDCKNPGIIVCVGECAAVKIEEKFKSGQRSGYFFGCASHVVRKAEMTKEPAVSGKKLCKEPQYLEFSYSHTADVTLCRCSGAECNNPIKKFVESDFPAAGIPTNMPETVIPTSVPGSAFHIIQDQLEPQEALPSYVKPKVEIYHASSSLSSKKAVNYFLLIMLVASITYYTCII